MIKVPPRPSDTRFGRWFTVYLRWALSGKRFP
jgi:hypothetical protein